MTTKATLKEKLENRSAVIGILGLGYVGLPLALCFVESDNQVVGFDIDDAKIEQLNAGESYIKQISAERIQDAVKKGFKASSDFSQAHRCDALILCVPTPLTKHREPDLSFVRITVESILPHIRAGQILSLESTTFPGTTEELILPRLEKQGYNIGKDYFLVYSPEREDPGNQEFTTKTIPKVVGGQTPSCLEMGTALYKNAVETIVPVSSTKAAEMTKLLENIYRAVNIGLVNEMKIVADKMDINIHEVIDAAATKPFGFTKYSPGPGLGGHCIPIDPFYLTWKAKEYGINTRFIELAGEINRSMPEWVAFKLIDALNERGKALKGSKILILGIAYKKNTDDPRESPAVALMEILREKGAVLSYSDPYIPAFPEMREHYFDLSSIELDEKTLKEFDAAVLVTDHDDFDYPLIEKHAKLIIDTRNRFDNLTKCVHA